MPATVDDATGVVPMPKLAVVAPCCTVTEAGTVADALLLDRATTALLVAAPVNVSVPVDESPPITLVGLTVIEESAAGGFELKVALTDFAASMVMLQAPVPLQAPPQPANVEPESGVTAKLTTVPLEKFTEHVVPQEIPEGVLVTVPVPVPLLDTARVKGPGFAVKFALTDFAASMVTLQAPVPLHAPLQPANVEPESGAAVKLTTVPLEKFDKHVVPQEIPEGVLVTVPAPVPLLATVRVKGPEFAVKFALTDFAASMVTLQAPVPLHAPLQPANVEPESGAAVRFTTAPLSKFAEHVGPQEIPAGELTTVPVPVPLFVTVSAKDVGGAPVINLFRTFLVAC
jgi:hypothetical protein